MRLIICPPSSTLSSYHLTLSTYFSTYQSYSQLLSSYLPSFLAAQKSTSVGSTSSTAHTPLSPACATGNTGPLVATGSSIGSRTRSKPSNLSLTHTRSLHSKRVANSSTLVPASVNSPQQQRLKGSVSVSCRNQTTRINSAAQRRHNSSSLGSVTGLTQELFRITAFRNSFTSTMAVPLGMDPPTADHLVVLVHGLWGNPSHMEYLASTIKRRYDDSQLIVHVAAKNSGNYTYDGIELGGERLAREIEDLLEDFSSKGVIIRKFSIVGYSLGGLVSRYVVGVLHAKGIFDKIEPVNFTTFATPHLGVRTPKLGFHNHIWNVIGARTLSASGRQLFTIDKFRDTNRPLLSILADKELAFWRGLSRFKNRVLYANIVNDRSTTFFTSGISRYDVFSDLDMVEYKYLPGTNDVIIDEDAGVALRPPPMSSNPSAAGASADDDDEKERNLEQRRDGSRRPGRTARDFIRDLPFVALYTLLIPVGFCFFLINAGIQTYSSSKRIRLHSQELKYNIPLFASSAANEVQETMDNVIMGGINYSQSPDHLPEGDEEGRRSGARPYGSPTGSNISPTAGASNVSLKSTVGSARRAEEDDAGDSEQSIDEGRTRFADSVGDSAAEFASTATGMPDFPTLALAPYQFDMIDSLDQLNFKKFPVHIHKVKHSHAAIIVRNPKNEGFSEGKIVIRHWLDGWFEV